MVKRAVFSSIRDTVGLAFAYLGVIVVALVASVGSWTPSLAAVWDVIAQPQRDAWAYIVVTFPVAFAAALGVCVAARFVFRLRGVPWHLFVSGAVAASCGGFTVWLGFVVEEFGIEGWLREVPMLLWLAGPALIVAGLLWQFIRRVRRVEIPASVSSGAEQGVLPRW